MCPNSQQESDLPTAEAIRLSINMLCEALGMFVFDLVLLIQEVGNE